MFRSYVASFPGHFQLFNVSRENREGLVHVTTCLTSNMHHTVNYESGLARCDKPHVQVYHEGRHTAKIKQYLWCFVFFYQEWSLLQGCSQDFRKREGGGQKCKVIACKARIIFWTGSHTHLLNHVGLVIQCWFTWCEHACLKLVKSFLGKK